MAGVKESSLARVPLFAGLPEDDLRTLASHAVARRFRKNTIVVSMGEESDTMYIVLSGRLRVYIDDDEGNEITMRLLEAGDVFGELALLSGAPRSANVMTIEDCELSIVSRSRFMECLAANSQVASRIIRALVHLIHELTDDVSTLALLDVYGRVRRTLERLARERDGKRVTDRLTHQELANMVGSSREMVSRILRDLKAGGYISTQDKRITIEKDLPAGW
jgi:CRP/FNR family transcriptional regulator, cyclic AMP receptor protein